MPHLKIGKFNAYLGLKGFGAYFETDATGRTYNLNSSEFDRLFQAITGQYTDSNLVELFHSVPEIFAPIHEIASRVSDAVWELKMFKNEQVVYDDADFNRLFTQPNPLLAFKSFIYQAVCYELVTGKQYFYFNIPDTLPFDYKNVTNWWNLPAHKTTIERPHDIKVFSATDITDFIRSYKVDGYATGFRPEKVLAMHQGNLSWDSTFLTGKSPLLSASKAIVNLIAVYEARNVIYVKRGALGIVVSKKSDQSGLVSLTNKEKEGLLKEFNEKYGVSRKKSPIAITEAPIDFIRVAMSIQELQPFEETLADAAAIYATLRVPAHLIPSKDKSTFNNAQTDMKSFYSDVIIPMAKRYAQSFTNFLKLDKVRRYVDVNFTHVDVLQENKKDKASYEKTMGEVYYQRFTAGVCTLNDWIIAAGGEKVSDPIYDKRIFQMEEEELAKVKAVLSLKSPVKPDNNQNANEDEKSDK